MSGGRGWLAAANGPVHLESYADLSALAFKEPAMNPTQNTPNAESHFNAPRTNENEVGNTASPSYAVPHLRCGKHQPVLLPSVPATAFPVHD